MELYDSRQLPGHGAKKSERNEVPRGSITLSNGAQITTVAVKREFTLNISPLDKSIHTIVYFDDNLSATVHRRLLPYDLV